MPNAHEDMVQNIMAKAAQDRRAQPWKENVDTRSPVSGEEWVAVGTPAGVDVRENAFPNGGTVDVRENAFPIGAIDVRANAFPTGGN